MITNIKRPTQLFSKVLIILSFFSILSCGSEGADRMDSKSQTVVMDVALFSYLEYPLDAVYLNGVDIGPAAGQPHRGEGGGLMTGVELKTGSQIITWADAKTGKFYQAKNSPILNIPPRGFGYLGVHIYPDNTVELIPEKYWPNKTERGLEINRAWAVKHGK